MPVSRWPIFWIWFCRENEAIVFARKKCYNAVVRVQWGEKNETGRGSEMLYSERIYGERKR